MRIKRSCSHFRATQLFNRGGKNRALAVIAGYLEYFQLKIHDKVDQSNPTGFTGLFREWETILEISCIDRNIAFCRPDEPLDVLDVSQDKKYNLQLLVDYRFKQIRVSEATYVDKKLFNDWEPSFIDTNPQESFDNAIKIGERPSCSVYRIVVWKRYTPVAVKRAVLKTPEDITFFKFERTFISSALHDNLINCLATSKLEENLFIFMERADAGAFTDLLSFLNDRKLHSN